MAKRNWGFDTKDMDRKVRPQDDFYQYAGGTWLKKNKIPREESRWGSFNILRKHVDHQLHALVRELLTKKRTKHGSSEQLLADFFKSGMDQKTREKLGITPLMPLMNRIRKIRSMQDMLDEIARLHSLGIEPGWSAGIDQDLKDSERYSLYLTQGGLSLPDRDYYLKDDAESRRVREAFITHMPKLMALIGMSRPDAVRRAGIVMKIETELAKHSMDKVDVRDYDKTYHKMSLSQLQRLASGINWKRYLKATALHKAAYVIVTQPDFFKQLDKMLETVPLEDWKVYLEWHVLNDSAGMLSKAFVNRNFAFYGRVMTGVKQMRPHWRRILTTVNSGLGEALGQLYVERHFSSRAKERTNELVADLFKAYERHIKRLDWMTPETKRKALKKLRSLNHKIGYPDKWKSYKGLVIRPDDYFGNVQRTSAFMHRREARKLGRPIDRKEWYMFPQTVNAYFAPTLNDIVFPAGILQPPFFDLSADNAINYGSIGTVIGHEMTHGFDDQGSKFDDKGNLKSWWKKQDRMRFNKKTELLARQYDAYTVADGVHVNGKLTLGENVADLGGIAIGLDAYRSHLAKHPEEDRPVDGFTPLQRFFLGVSLFERELVRPESQKTRALTDPHSPGIYRVNGPASNMTEFYEAFGVKKGDKLYRAPKDRAKIW